jgi:transposase
MTGAIEFNRHIGAHGLNNQVFKYYGVNKRSGYRILTGESSQTDRRLQNEPEVHDPRGRPRELSRDQLQQIESYLEHADVKQRAVTWENLARQAGVQTDVYSRTIRRAMGALDYHKYITYDKAWVSNNIRRGRRIWCQEQRAARPKEEDWFNVRFLDEVHFRLGP